MENYEIIGPLGKGSFGSVTKIQRKSDRKILVWKEINYSGMSEKEKQQLVTEVNILRSLSNPHIVKYVDRILDKAKKTIYIVMEHCEGGDLSQLLKSMKRSQDFLPEEAIWKIFMQVSIALLACHRREAGRVIHRDIKPSNIFLSQQLDVKLGDFGLSRIMGEQSEYAQTRVGTPYYMSPEQVTEARYNEQSDIWSLGCLVYEMAALRPPFEAKNQITLSVKIKNGSVERIPGRYSEDLWRVIQNMLNVEFTQRPTVEDILSFPPIAQKRKEKMLRESQAQLKAREDELNKAKERLLKQEEELKKKENDLKEREDRVAAQLAAQRTVERPPTAPARMREDGDKKQEPTPLEAKPPNTESVPLLQLRPVRALSPADQRAIRANSPVLTRTGVMVLSKPRSALTQVGQEGSLEAITRTILERRNKVQPKP